jgi:uncharacterized protein YjbK
VKIGRSSMTQEIEIEFKNMLTKAQYEALLQHFHIQPKQIKYQVNHYFDTESWHLKQLMSGLRIRQIGDHFECTLKEKTTANAHLETTDSLTKEQAEQLLNGASFSTPSVSQRLKALNIPIDELKLIGSLATNRVELNYKGGILVFDHSIYMEQNDYEVEYEAIDEATGQIIFNEFLATHQIEQNSAQKKIARFMNALQKKG